MDSFSELFRAWSLAEQGETVRAHELLDSVGALAPGLDVVRREFLGAWATGAGERGDDGSGPGEVGAPSLDLPTWLSRVKAWREVLGV